MSIRRALGSISSGWGYFKPTIAITIKISSHPKDFTSLIRTKHRSATDINDITRKTAVTTKMLTL